MAFHHHHSERHAGNDAVSNGEIFRCGVCAQRKFTDDRATLQHFLVQLFVFLWITHVDACSEHSDRAAVGIHRSLMPDGINPAGHTADDDQAARGQVPAKTVRHLRSVKSWPARPNDAEAGQIQDLWITANVEQDRRIVDL
ncbi:MAG TPA: hypothetical protein VER56_02820 [Candidatus Eisenbacteria bacterium]|nr:hypothetical protein [Candidatus Eisenbacteria bacterium]